jgi:DNA-3-methyladenine glycosylase
MESNRGLENHGLQLLSRERIEQFFGRCVDDVAAGLIGMFIFNKADGSLLGGKIIETEAYCGNDRAAHCHPDSFRFKSSGPMRSPGGHVYRHYSRGGCLNLTCGLKNKKFGSAVLIRALQPIPRHLPRDRDPSEEGVAQIADTNLCNGPVKLCTAMQLERNQYNGQPLWETKLELWEPVGRRDVIVKCGKRINISDKEVAGWPRSYILDGAEIFLSPPAKRIERREHFPPTLLQQLKTSGCLKDCMCPSI